MWIILVNIKIVFLTEILDPKHGISFFFFLFSQSLSFLLFFYYIFIFLLNTKSNKEIYNSVLSTKILIQVTFHTKNSLPVDPFNSFNN